MPYIGNSHNVGTHVNNFKVLDDISSHVETFNGSAAAIVSTSDNSIRVPDHRFVQGQRVVYNNGGGGNIGGLTSGTAYFISFDSHNTIKLAATLADANTNNVINLASVGSGSSHTITSGFDGINTVFKLTFGGKTARVNNAAQLNIAINNVVQRPNLNHLSFTDGIAIKDFNTIVFKNPPTVNDVFWGSIIANTIDNFDVADNKLDNFTGDGTTTAFTLSAIPSNPESVLVSLDGVVQHTSDNVTTRAYSISGSVLTFTSAPALGVEIQARHIRHASPSSPVKSFYGRSGNVVLTNQDSIVVKDLAVGPGLLSESFKNFTSSGINGTYNHNVITDGLIWHGTQNAAGTWVFNVRGDASTTFNSMVAIGQATTVTLYAPNNSAANYMTAFQIDGSAQTVKYAGGSAPSAGTGSGVDVYSITILKTGNSTYSVFGNLTNFA